MFRLQTTMSVFLEVLSQFPSWHLLFRQPSPEVNGREVTFRVPVEKTGDAASVTVPGGMNGWKQDSSDWELKKDETAGMWSGTFTIAPGKYEYKFALNKTWDVSFSDYNAISI